MTSLRLAVGSVLLASAALVPARAEAQEMPADYKACSRRSARRETSRTAC